MNILFHEEKRLLYLNVREWDIFVSWEKKNNVFECQGMEYLVS